MIEAGQDPSLGGEAMDFDGFLRMLKVSNTFRRSATEEDLFASP